MYGDIGDVDVNTCKYKSKIREGVGKEEGRLTSVAPSINYGSV
jgi:hypothetical protein